ncbi:hypothetical protein Tco_0872651 [Tanacetum coccineum]
MANDPNNVQGLPPVGPNFQNPNPDLRPMEELLPAPTDGYHHWSGVTLVGPSVPPPPLSSSKEVERDPESELTTQEPVVLTGEEVPQDVLNSGKTISSRTYTHSNNPRVSYPDYYLSSRYSRGCLSTSGRSHIFFPVNDFVVVDYDVDPCVPLILGRPFLRTTHSLVDVHGEELTLRVGDEKLVFNVESTSKYPRNYGDESIHKIDILDIACEDHFYEVLNVQKLINLMSGSLTPSSDPVVASLSPSLTPFGDSDFILEEIDTFLASNDSISPDIDDRIFDPEGDIRLIKEFLNNEIPNDLPHPLPVFEINETEKIKTSIYNPLDLELKDLPPHLEYAFLEGTSKLPVIIAKT